MSGRRESDCTVCVSFRLRTASDDEVIETTVRSMHWDGRCEGCVLFLRKYYMSALFHEAIVYCTIILCECCSSRMFAHRTVHAAGAEIV